MDHVIKLQSGHVLLHLPVIRLPQEDLARMEEVDLERWANHRTKPALSCARSWDPG